MIISLPNDGTGYLYHIIDLRGETVHVYRDNRAALNSLIGDQRIFIQIERTGEWIDGEPTPSL
jgi:hypothetical protein